MQIRAEILLPLTNRSIPFSEVLNSPTYMPYALDPEITDWIWTLGLTRVKPEMYLDWRIGVPPPPSAVDGRRLA